MELNIKLNKVLPVQSGTSANGKVWQSVTFIGETLEQYPKTVAFELFGDKTAIIQNMTPMSDYTVHFDIKSRSWTDKSGVERWSTSVLAYRVDPLAQVQSFQAPVAPSVQGAAPAAQYGAQQPQFSAPQPGAGQPQYVPQQPAQQQYTNPQYQMYAGQPSMQPADPNAPLPF